jgi:hypothetical protein
MKRKDVVQKGIVEKDMTVRELAGIMTVRFDGLEKRVEKLEVVVSDLREDMMYEFKAIDERFNALTDEMNRKFDLADKRFEKLETKIDIVDKKLTYEFKSLSLRVDSLEEKTA